VPSPRALPRRRCGRALPSCPPPSPHAQAYAAVQFSDAEVGRQLALPPQDSLYLLALARDGGLVGFARLVAADAADPDSQLCVPPGATVVASADTDCDCV
jgi:hypothetical protein